MKIKDKKYYLLVLAYVISILLMELFPNILIGLITLILITLSLISIAFIIVKWKKRALKRSITLLLLLSIPFLDITLGVSNIIRDSIKGDIVFTAIEKSFATSDHITIRDKNDELFIHFEVSAAGFGYSEKSNLLKINDSTLTYNNISVKKFDTLIINKNHQFIRSTYHRKRYRVLSNELFKSNK